MGLGRHRLILKLLPAAWLGNGDPTWVVGEIALLSLIVIPIVWWVARSIGGPAAGLTAALLAATSAALVSFATFIWNPTLVEPGAALALLGAWQAVRSSRPQWWVVAALGAAVAVQAHIAAAVGTPVLGIYGPTDPLLQGPCGENNVVVRNEGLNCLGCNLTVCPIGHPCMLGLGVETVLQGVRVLLARNRITP